MPPCRPLCFCNASLATVWIVGQRVVVCGTIGVYCESTTDAVTKTEAQAVGWYVDYIARCILYGKTIWLHDDMTYNKVYWRGTQPQGLSRQTMPKQLKDKITIRDGRVPNNTKDNKIGKTIHNRLNENILISNIFIFKFDI